MREFEGRGMRDEPAGRLENWKALEFLDKRDFQVSRVWFVRNGNYPAMRTGNWRPGGAGVLVLMRQGG